MLKKKLDNTEKYARLTVLCMLISGILGVIALFVTTKFSVPETAGEETALAASTEVPTGPSRSETKEALTEAPVTSSESEDSADTLTEASSETAAPPEEFEIVDSSYQYANGYDWEDMFVILLEITRTSPCLEGNEPAFSLFTLPGSDRHFLSIGYRGEGEGQTEYHLYTVDEGFVYELLVFNEPLYYSPSLEKFYLSYTGAAYTYTPHVLLETIPESVPEDLIAIPVYSLVGKKIIAEKLKDYVTDFNGGDE